MTKFLNKYRIESNRLKDFDYGSNGYYFITINTYKKSKYFGEIIYGVETEYIPSLQPTEIAVIAQKYWNEIPQHFSFVKLDEFIVMPDHLHGILMFEKSDKRIGPQIHLHLQIKTLVLSFVHIRQQLNDMLQKMVLILNGRTDTMIELFGIQMN
jgi:REP element-mobilizing transposase RayT